MNTKEITPDSNPKPGFFKRLVDKLDTAMKAKADEAVEKGSCCCSDNDDSDSCCSDDKEKGSKCC